MAADLTGEVTRLLQRVAGGEDDAKNELADVVYDSLRGLADRLMWRERQDHMLQPSALVNEAWLRLERGQFFATPRNRHYFYASAAQAMRRILVEHARRPRPKGQAIDSQVMPLDLVLTSFHQNNVDILALNDALEVLKELSLRQHDLVQLKFFAGLTNREIADILEVSVGTVEKDYRAARAFLHRNLSSANEDER